jgi:Fic/DOC family
MPSKKSHQWSPIEDLPEDWKSLANSQVSALVRAWISQADELRQGSAYDDFLVKMRREWAIETGFIERLYRISEGATKTLIEQGLDAALLLHEDVDRSPDEVIAIINDQYNAIEGLYQFVSGDRELGKSYIRELHQVLTAHQPTYEAIDTLGNRVVRDLPRGVWKSLPNNVGDSEEGYYFEFCPPEHVENEMERLLRMHQEHEIQGVPPDLEAAWLHHRFTLIHPFTDGNGRVARCLASLILLKAGWFPLVVTRRDAGYINAIREADRDDLKPLVDLFGSLQSRAVTKAFSLSEEMDRESKAIGSILGAVRDKFARIRDEQESSKQQVLAIGDALHHLATIRLTELANEITETIRDLGFNFKADLSRAARGEKEAQFYGLQISNAANQLEYNPDFHSYSAWALLTIKMEFSSEILIAFHGIGREFTGVLAVVAMFYTKHMTFAPATIIGNVISLSNDPFIFTYDETEREVINRFRPWLEERLILGLDHWRKSIGA